MSLITLGVSDINRARAFYRAMGWSEGAGSTDEVVFFQVGGVVFGLWDRSKLAEDSAVTDAGGWGGVTLAYNTRTREDVDEVIDLARESGATLGRAPGDTFWGGYSGVFIDPDGHPWEVAHNPFWSVDAEGSTFLGG